MATIAFYGKLAEMFGREAEADVPARGCTVAALRARFPGLAARACVNDATVGDEHVVMPGDRVEFLPPLSGG